MPLATELDACMDGVIIIDKPSGWTSHDVVSKVKGTLKAKKVGHLGTLDPMATGVLPLVVNKATKYAQHLDTGSKGYRAVLKLGVQTDTWDAEGRVIASADFSAISEEDIVKALSGFRGRIRQVPPMYSAIKKNGTPLYKLARKGVEIEREAKEVEIHSLEILKVDLPFVEVTVECSKGTYIRSIAHDAGLLLGCGAHLFSLRRTACGQFREAGAAGPKASRDELLATLIPLGVLMADLSVSGEKKACDHNGQAVGQ